MSKKDEKYIHRIIAQKEGITITAETSNEVTFEEAKNTAIAEVLGGVDKVVSFQPFVVIPLTTKERWDDKTINFCPRCGSNLKDYELEQAASFECLECDTSMDVHIHNWLED
ncbi:transposase [Bacillus sp. FJAT-45350]|uniref:transposase n=1 Tax=Bacillus sp. FJAT-45350 TaxID=2011014 RepID=UPI000BB6F0D1|nr:transposase [Bacillus sp. FJAT-45350]